MLTLSPCMTCVTVLFLTMTFRATVVRTCRGATLGRIQVYRPYRTPVLRGPVLWFDVPTHVHYPWFHVRRELDVQSFYFHANQTYVCSTSFVKPKVVAGLSRSTNGSILPSMISVPRGLLRVGGFISSEERSIYSSNSIATLCHGLEVILLGLSGFDHKQSLDLHEGC